jgi:PAS domain S-box-containing protein
MSSDRSLEVGANPTAIDAFLAGAGKMGALLRSIDWSGTGLGPIAEWPQSLRTTMSICLNSRFPIAVYRGPEFASQQLSRMLERAEDGERQFRQLVENLPDLAWTAPPDGFIDYYNRGWYEYTGTTEEEMEAWGWKVVHDPSKVDAVIERWQHSIGGGRHSIRGAATKETAMTGPPPKRERGTCVPIVDGSRIAAARPTAFRPDQRWGMSGDEFKTDPARPYGTRRCVVVEGS